MASVRWRKLRGDLRAARGRLAVMLVATALALAGVATVLGARTVLGREIAASYAGTQPADATLEVAGGVDDALLAEVRARPGIADAERRRTLRARVKARPDDPWQVLVLFVVDDFAHLRLATFRPESGAWPPPTGTVLVERTSPAVMGIGAGGHDAASYASLHGGHGAMLAAAAGADTLTVQTPHGEGTVAVAGTVHDPGQAPAWQEHRGCAYATLDTLVALGEPRELPDLLVRFAPDPASTADAARAATELAGWLRARGREVHEIRVPPLREHPHQRLMSAVQLVLLVFSGLLLVLCAIVVATLLAGILARQTREIGVMKTVGATTAQLAGLYAAFVAGFGAVAAAVALPLGYLGARGMIDGVARMMNLAVDDPSIPPWVFVAVALLGILVPLALAAPPIARAAGVTVRRALADTGAGDFVRPGLARLPVAIRNALRRPARLAVTATLLVASGAVVIAASNVQAGLGAIAGKVEVARRYDLEIRLRDTLPTERLPALDGVRVEGWAMADASLGDVAHTYPDGGHGSFALLAPPDGGSALVDYPLLEGRWLQPGDDDAIVLGHGAAGGVHAGDRVTVAIDGRATTWTVAGIVEEVGGGSGFVTPAAFRRATGRTGVRVLRIASSAPDDAARRAILARLEGALAAAHVPVDYAIPTPLLRTIIDDHVALVLRAVLAMAAILALVGLVALGSATAVAVAERTREIGVMKAIGASDRRIFRVIAGEAAFVGAATAVMAVALALPLTAFVDARIAANGFIAPPPFAIAWSAVLGWPLVAIAGSVAAAAWPARRAARMTVRAALDRG